MLQRLHELMPGSLGVKNNYGDTPAHSAADNGHVEVLQFLALVLSWTVTVTWVQMLL